MVVILFGFLLMGTVSNPSVDLRGSSLAALTKSKQVGSAAERDTPIPTAPSSSNRVKRAPPVAPSVATATPLSSNQDDAIAPGLTLKRLNESLIEPWALSHNPKLCGYAMERMRSKLFYLTAVGTDVEVKVATAFQRIIAAYMTSDRPGAVLPFAVSGDSHEKRVFFSQRAQETSTQAPSERQSAIVDIGVNDGADIETWYQLFGSIPSVHPRFIFVEPDRIFHQKISDLIVKSIGQSSRKGKSHDNCPALLVKAAMGFRSQHRQSLSVEASEGVNMKLTANGHKGEGHRNSATIPVVHLRTLLEEMTKHDAGASVEGLVEFVSASPEEATSSKFRAPEQFPFIKMDTEGADLSIIMSLEDLFLQRRIGIVVCELNSRSEAMGATTLVDVVRAVVQWGYRPFMVGVSGPRSTLLLFEIGGDVLEFFHHTLETMVIVPGNLVEAALNPDVKVVGLERQLLRPLTIVQRRSAILSTFSVQASKASRRGKLES